MKKLAFYFDKKSEDFEGVVMRNPALDFNDLVKICKDEEKKAEQIKE